MDRLVGKQVVEPGIAIRMNPSLERVKEGRRIFTLGRTRRSALLKQIALRILLALQAILLLLQCVATLAYSSPNLCRSLFCGVSKMTDRDNLDAARDSLLVALIDEKLKTFVKKNEIDEVVKGQIDGMVRRTRAPLKWFMAGVGAVLAVFAIDLLKYDSFARQTFARAFGMNKTIDDRTSQALAGYFENVEFLAGSYASSFEKLVTKCETILISLPFQADLDKHSASAFLSVAFPDSNHVYRLTPFVNAQALEAVVSGPKDRLFTSSSDYNFDLTKSMQLVPVNMRSSGFIHEHYVRIDVLPPATTLSAQLTGDKRLVALSGLPSKPPQDSGCPPVDNTIKARMLVQVSGDPRVKVSDQ